MDGLIYFNANDGVHGRELYRSDGTSSGTFIVSDATTGPTRSDPRYLANFNNVLYYQAAGNDHITTGDELWRSDGTSSGTYQLIDLTPGLDPQGKAIFSSPTDLVAAGNRLFFEADVAPYGISLWATDGTSSGTHLVRDLDPVALVTKGNYSLFDFNGQCYFVADGDPAGRELWRSDGTSSGTKVVHDIQPGTHASDPSHPTEAGGRIFFAANDGPHGPELWSSDGTSSGTVLMADANPGPEEPTFEEIKYLKNVNGTLFFNAFSKATGDELWKSDGTPGGTVLVRDLDNGNLNSSPRYFENVNGTLLFAASSGSSRPLFRSDGTSAGTTMVKGMNVRGDNGAFLNVGGILYFSGSTSFGNYELWRSDGTSSGTVLVRDVNAGSSYPDGFTNLNGIVYFFARAPIRSFWRSDGTSAGTWKVSDIPGDSLKVLDNKLYFLGAEGKFWRSDGTSNGTALVWASEPSDNLIGPLVDVNGILYFEADTAATGRELWRSDGTSSGTWQVADLMPGPADSFPEFLTNVNGALYFRALDGINGFKLWRSDGTASGTAIVPLESDPRQSVNPSNLLAIGDTLYFSGRRSDVGQELFKVQEVPGVSGLVVNSGDTQRSRITTITVNFDASIDVTLFQNPGAVTLTRTAGGPGTVVTVGSGLVVTPGAGNSTSITLTFQNVSMSGVENGSLADGRWQLTIPSLNYQSALNDSNLRRLFGDVDANGTVDATDFGAFGAAFGGVSIAFDFDNNGTTDALDLGHFGNRFGLTL